MKNAVLVTLADKNYIDQAKQLFSSVYHYSGWKGNYLLLAYDIPESKLKWFRNKGIIIKKVKPHKNDKFKDWPSTILCKFELFNTYFKKWQHVVFLDGDIIVKASLDRVLGVSGIGAISDLNHNMWWQFKNKRYNGIYKTLINNMDMSKKSFNVGVLSINTDIIKKETYSTMLELYSRYRKIVRYPEQAIMNIYFHKNWKRLPAVYNTFILPKALWFSKLHNDGIILHMIMRPKPWESKTLYSEEWKYNLDIADEIDLNHRLPAKDIWNEKRVKKVSAMLENRYFIFEIDRIIGKVGIAVKKISPNLYKALKKISRL
ncbi:hypothetical protein H6503_02515 [Candidatus Woesearchaeota archaeon]|nr:hypothetical protein [Candidatus Woesearchaeota archaeon]